MKKITLGSEGLNETISSSPYSNRSRLASESNRTSPTILETDEEGNQDGGGFKDLFGSNFKEETRCEIKDLNHSAPKFFFV